MILYSINLELFFHYNFFTRLIYIEHMRLLYLQDN